MRRSEGVGVVMDSQMTTRKEAGEVWKAVRSRIMIVNDLETGKNTQTSICRERDLPKKHCCHDLGKLIDAEELGRRWSVFFVQKENAQCIPHVDLYNYVLLC